MSHLDEGTLHALLDGELELAEVKEIQIHLGACSACGSRLQDVKEFLAEADRLVGTLETPAGAPKARREPAPPPPVPASRPAPREPVWDSEPELFLPESTEDAGRRRRWLRGLRWAAMIAVVIGAGQILRSAFSPTAPRLELSERDMTTAAPPTPPAVASPEETGRPQAGAARDTPAPPANRTRTPLPAPKAVATEPVTDTPRDPVDTAVETNDDASARNAQVLAAAGRADSEVVEPFAAPNRPETDQDVATRQAAAAALEELDRERIRSRAAAATAALPPARAEPQPVAEAPPPPRTLEQRSQIYLRIGLDEAAKQLGRPVHVIEAMTPEFMGLTQGRLVAGADPSRPVVRVVYQDPRGRMILLDQQRMRTGQAPGAPGGNLRWALGDVMLYLHGEPGSDVLRNLQRRVR